MTARSRQLDLALAACALALSVLVASGAARTQPGSRPLDDLAYATVILCCAALAVRRRRPLPVAVICGAALLLFAVRNYPGGPLLLPVTIALYTVGTALSRRQALLAGAVATLVVVVRAWATTAGHGQVSAYTWAAPGWVVAALVWGVAVRARRQAIEALKLRAEEAERSREQLAARRVADERLRIARDLHDVIGHSFATVNVQARVAATVLDTDPVQARQALSAIETTSRDTLREIRQALSVLRDTAEADATTGDTAPSTIGIGQLGRLTEPLQAAGLTVSTRIDLAERTLPIVISTGVYRIVQEAFTNVLKHAAATTVTLTLGRDPHTLHIEVTDDGTGKTGSVPSDGSGITGMRERAQALGGRLEAGPLPGRGFRVTAHIPVED